MIRYTTVFLLFYVSIAFGQNQPITFEHNALLVKNVKESARFYGEVMGLTPIEVPGGDEERRWFDMGNGLQLHLIEGDNSALVMHKSIHMAFRVPEIDPLVTLLRERQIMFYSWPGEENVVTTRADGIHQVYIRDPDGYWIEINDM